MKPEKEQIFFFVSLQKGNDRLGWIQSRREMIKKSRGYQITQVYDGGGVEKCYPVDMAF